MLRNKKDIEKYLTKILFTEKDIEKAVKKAGKWIDETYKNIDDQLLLVPILNGSIPFVGKLATSLNKLCIVDSMRVQSYAGTVTNKTPRITVSTKEHVKNKHILIVEDVIDTGYTFNVVKKELINMGAKNVKLLTLLNKPKSHKVKVDVDYACFEIEPEFVIGFGLDYKGMFRDLPYIGVLNYEKYKKEVENE